MIKVYCCKVSNHIFITSDNHTGYMQVDTMGYSQNFRQDFIPCACDELIQEWEDD